MIRDEAEKIAASVDSNKVGFDPITIITIVTTLLPMLMNLPCFKSEATSAKEFLADRYDPVVDKFDDHVYDQCRPRARRAARREGIRHASTTALDEITHKSLLHAMNADESTVVACSQEAVNTIQDE